MAHMTCMIVVCTAMATFLDSYSEASIFGGRNMNLSILQVLVIYGLRIKKRPQFVTFMLLLLQKGSRMILNPRDFSVPGEGAVSY